MFRFAPSPANFALDEHNMVMYVVNNANILTSYKMYHQGAEQAPWEANLGQCDQVLAITSRKKLVTASSNTLIFASFGEDGSLVKDAQIGTEHSTKIKFLAVSDDERLIFTGSALESEIKVHEMLTRDSLPDMKGHRAPITCLFFRGGRLYSGSKDASIGVWTKELENECFLKTAGPTGQVTVSEDLSQLAYGLSSTDGKIRIMDLAEKKELCFFEGHTAPPLQLKFILGGMKLVSSNYEDGIMIWCIEGRAVVARFSGTYFATMQDDLYL